MPEEEVGRPSVRSRRLTAWTNHHLKHEIQISFLNVRRRTRERLVGPALYADDINYSWHARE